VTYAAVRATALSVVHEESRRSTRFADRPAVPAPEAVDVSVVVPVIDRFQRACRWLRVLYRTHLAERGEGGVVELLVCVTSPTDRRLAAAVALSLPGTRVVVAIEGSSSEALLRAGLDSALGRVTVLVDPTLEPPARTWLHHLADRLDDEEVGVVSPLLVEPDQTVVAAGAAYDEHGRLVPFLRGETPADAERAAHLSVPALWPGVVAVRTADARRNGWLGTGAAYVVPQARVVSPPGPRDAAGGVSTRSTGDNPRESSGALWEAAGFEGPGRPIRVRDGRPSLRWALDIAAPLAPRGRRWGDDPFARSLAASLEALGQWVTVDHPETRTRASRDHDDVLLVIRGLEPVPPTVADQDVAARLMWVISHPEDVTAAECSPYDLVFAAGPTWAAERSRAWAREIRPLLQCTDSRRFHPGLAEADTGPEFLFVGNSRGELRPVVRAAREAGLDLTMYGDGWAELVEPGRVTSINVANEQLGPLYASAGVVLCDHWSDMREQGFVSNRIFDALACGARILCDDVGGLHDLVGDAVSVWTSAEDLRRLEDPGWRRHFPGPDERRRTAELVVAEHSFDARAAALLHAALSVAGRTA